MRTRPGAPWAILLPIAAVAGGCAAEPESTNTVSETPTLVETEDQTSALLPSLAMNPEGTALVVWTQTDGTSDEIWSNRYTPQTGWGTAQPIEGSTGTTSGGPRVAVDKEGNGVAVWSMSDGTSYRIWASRHTTGTGWEPAELIEGDADGDAGVPDLAMDSAGNALVTWPSASEVWTNRFEPGNGWGAAELLESSTGFVSARIAANADGDAVIVYLALEGTASTLVGARYTLGTGWGETTVINSVDQVQAGLVTVTNRISNLQVAMTGDGMALALWESQGHPAAALQSARATAAGDWEFDSTPQDNQGGAQPQLAFSATGEGIAAWTPSGFLNTTNGVLASHYHPNLGWEAIEFVQENGSDYPQDVRLAASASGHFGAVWSLANEGQSTLWLNRYESGSGWETGHQIATTSTLDPEAQVAIDAAGNALVVWLTGDETHPDLMAQLFPSE